MLKEFSYIESLRNLAERKASLLFANSERSNALDTLCVILETADEDLFIYEKTFNDFIHNNEKYINSLKVFLNKNHNLYIILHNDDIFEEFNKLYKSFGFNITIKKADEKIILNASQLKQKDVGNVTGMYFTKNAYVIFTQSERNEPIVIGNFNDILFCEKLKKVFVNNFNDLKDIKIIKNNKPPHSIDEVFEKFKHLSIEKKDLIEILEFVQCK